MSFTIELLADHVDLVPTIARWHWDEWGCLDHDGSLESWTANLATYTLRDAIPTAFVAIEGISPVGSVSLVKHDMSIYAELSPWLSGLYVRPEFRRQGIGAALVKRVVKAAAELGVDRLYLYTHPAPQFYARLGWREVTRDRYDGQDITIMCIETSG